MSKRLGSHGLVNMKSRICTVYKIFAKVANFMVTSAILSDVVGYAVPFGTKSQKIGSYHLREVEVHE